MLHALVSGLSAIPSGAAAQGSAWLLTYLLHSTLFLGLAWLLARGLLSRRPALEETVWRFALVAALVTASVQIASGYEPLAGRFGLTAADPPPAPAATVSPLPLLSEPRIALEPGTLTRPVRVSAAPRPAPVRLPWTSLLAGLWAAGALALGVRWLAAHVVLHRRLRARPEVVGGDMHGVLRRLLAGAGLPRPVRLTVSWRLPVPIALGLSRREICVPPRAVAALAAEEQEGLLAHELAHLVRHDPFWLALSQLLASVLFVQPLNYVARRRLRELSELRSDEWAVSQTGRPLSLARCLTEVAGWSFRPFGPLVAPSMADRPSHLTHRIRRLLDSTRSPERQVHPVWLAAGLAALLVVAGAAAPGVSAAGPKEGAPVASGPSGTGPTGPDAVPPAGSPAQAHGPQPTAPSGSGQAAAPSPGHEPHKAAPGEASEDEADDFDLDLNVDPEIDLHIDPHIDLDFDQQLEAALANADAAAAAGMEAALANLSSLGEQRELTAEEETALEQKLDALNDELEHRLKPQLEEMERKLEKEMEGLEKSPAMEKLRAQAEEMSRRMRPSEAEMEALHAKIAAIQAEGMSSEERGRIREEARALAEKYRMTDQQRAEMRELARKAREEQQAFMREHRAEIDAMRKAIQEQASAMREEIRRRMDSDPQLRALRERRRQDMRKHSEEMEKHRDEIRQRVEERREEMRKERERQREKLREKRDERSVQREHGHPHPKPEPKAHPEPHPKPQPHPAGKAVPGGVSGGIPGGVAGGVRGGIPGGIRGGVAGGVQGGVEGGVAGGVNG